MKNGLNLHLEFLGYYTYILDFIICVEVELIFIKLLIPNQILYNRPALIHSSVNTTSMLAYIFETLRHKLYLHVEV